MSANVTSMSSRATAIGKAIKMARIKRSISQRELAQKIGLSSNYLCLLETGKRMPSFHTLQKLGRILDIHPEELLFGNKLGREMNLPPKTIYEIKQNLERLLDLLTKATATRKIKRRFDNDVSKERRRSAVLA